MDAYIMDTYIMHEYMLHGYMHGIKLKKEGVVTCAWITRHERQKYAKDKGNRHKGPPTRSRGRESP